MALQNKYKIIPEVIRLRYEITKVKRHMIDLRKRYIFLDVRLNAMKVRLMEMNKLEKKHGIKKDMGKVQVLREAV